MLHQPWGDSRSAYALKVSGFRWIIALALSMASSSLSRLMASCTKARSSFGPIVAGSPRDLGGDGLCSALVQRRGKNGVEVNGCRVLRQGKAQPCCSVGVDVNRGPVLR